MQPTQPTDAVLEFLLGYVDTARLYGAQRVTVVAGQVYEQVPWEDPRKNVNQICDLLESRAFQEWVGVVLVHRVGLRGTQDATFLYDLLETSNPSAIPTDWWTTGSARPSWRVRLSWTWEALRPVEKAALIMGPVVVLAIIAAFLWARSQQIELRWPPL